MMELTPDDIERASDLGMDDAENQDHTGEKPAVMGGDKLWTRIMGEANRTDYPNTAVATLRGAYDRGRSDYW